MTEKPKDKLIISAIHQAAMSDKVDKDKEISDEQYRILKANRNKIYDEYPIARDYINDLLDSDKVFSKYFRVYQFFLRIYVLITIIVPIFYEIFDLSGYYNFIYDYSLGISTIFIELEWYYEIMSHVIALSCFGFIRGRLPGTKRSEYYIKHFHNYLYDLLYSGVFDSGIPNKSVHSTKKETEASEKIADEKKSNKEIVRDQKFDYDIALSYAGEDREIVEELANILKGKGVKVFYDNYEKVHLWGKDLYQHLQEIYRDKALFCIIFLSINYSKKLWTKHELQQAQARAFQEKKEYILPVRLDDTKLPHINETIGYIDLRKTTVGELSELIVQKIQKYSVQQNTKKTSQVKHSNSSGKIIPKNIDSIVDQIILRLFNYKKVLYSNALILSDGRQSEDSKVRECDVLWGYILGYSRQYIRAHYPNMKKIVADKIVTKVYNELKNYDHTIEHVTGTLESRYLASYHEGIKIGKIDFMNGNFNEIAYYITKNPNLKNKLDISPIKEPSKASSSVK